jgi:hypothetical protein
MPARGCIPVEHADGKVHAIDMGGLIDYPLWRSWVVCGASTGVTSDEGGHFALRPQDLTCSDCISIIS